MQKLREEVLDGPAAAAGQVQQPRLQPQVPQNVPGLPVQQLQEQVTRLHNGYTHASFCALVGLMSECTSSHPLSHPLSTLEGA